MKQNYYSNDVRNTVHHFFYTKEELSVQNLEYSSMGATQHRRDCMYRL